MDGRENFVSKISLGYHPSYATVLKSFKILDPECSSPYLQLIPYFCGNIEKCRSKKNWDWALERAKKNVQGNFAVIGLLEEEEKSIRLLEWTLPTFFDGAR